MEKKEDTREKLADGEGKWQTASKVLGKLSLDTNGMGKQLNTDATHEQQLKVHKVKPEMRGEMSNCVKQKIIKGNKINYNLLYSQ